MSRPDRPPSVQRDPDPEGPERLPNASKGGLFDDSTDSVLIFDGGDHLVGVDVDTGALARWDLPRDAVEDQPFPLIRLGGWLVVADDGSAWAVGPGRADEHARRRLGDADHVLPDARPDRLWLVVEPDDAAGHGSSTLVDGSGTVVHEVPVRSGLTPLRGVPGDGGALALHDTDASSIHFYDLEQDAIVENHVGRFVSVANQHRMILCADPCQTLLVTDEEREPIADLGTEDIVAFLAEDVWLSGDGSMVAARAMVSHDDGAVGLELQIYDVEDATLIARTSAALGDAHGAWSLDGRRFFYRATMVGPPTELIHYVVGGDGFAITELDAEIVPPAAFVALPRSPLEHLLFPAETGADDRQGGSRDARPRQKPPA